MTPSTDLVVYEKAPFPDELSLCQDAIGALENLLYEAWEMDGSLTKDAARRFLTIAEIFGWDFDWVAEMREWVA